MTPADQEVLNQFNGFLQDMGKSFIFFLLIGVTYLIMLLPSDKKRDSKKDDKDGNI